METAPSPRCHTTVNLRPLHLLPSPASRVSLCVTKPQPKDGKEWKADELERGPSNTGRLPSLSHLQLHLLKSSQCCSNKDLNINGEVEPLVIEARNVIVVTVVSKAR